MSPRFAEMFDASAHRALKRDKFKLHFQYLMAGERVTDYDYFAITAGGRYLAERFAQTPGVRNYRDLLPFWRRR